MDQETLPSWDPGDARDTFRAALDRLIPADDFPGAWDAGAGDAVARALAGAASDRAPLIEAGLQALDAEALDRFGTSFPALDTAQQDAVLAAAETGTVRAARPVPAVAFFNALHTLTNEGYYGGPRDGNRDEMVSWRMIGYRPGPAATRGGV